MIHPGLSSGWGQHFGDYRVNKQLPSAGEFPRRVQTASPLEGWGWGGGIRRLGQEPCILGWGRPGP